MSRTMPGKGDGFPGPPAPAPLIETATNAEWSGQRFSFCLCQPKGIFDFPPRYRHVVKRAAGLGVSERKDFQALHDIYFSFKLSQKGRTNDVSY